METMQFDKMYLPIIVNNHYKLQLNEDASKLKNDDIVFVMKNNKPTKYVVKGIICELTSRLPMDCPYDISYRLVSCKPIKEGVKGTFAYELNTEYDMIIIKAKDVDPTYPVSIQNIANYAYSSIEKLKDAIFYLTYGSLESKDDNDENDNSWTDDVQGYEENTYGADDESFYY